MIEALPGKQVIGVSAWTHVDLFTFGNGRHGKLGL